MSLLGSLSLRRGLTLACALASLLAAPSLVASQAATVGTVEPRTFALDAAAIRTATTQMFSSAGSSFLTIHFASFQLAGDDKVIVRSPDSVTQFAYTGLGRGALGMAGGFFSSRIPGDTAVVEFVPAAAASQPQPQTLSGGPYGFVVDQITRTAKSFAPLTICGTDDTRPAKCFVNDTAVYRKAAAVARLLVKGQNACTGWLVGSQGHLLSNYHCLGESNNSLVTDYEFQAESGSCDDECRVRGGCAGTVVASSAQVVASSESLDYALVKLDTTADLSIYGFLTLRVAGPQLAEPIYLPQHPAGFAKRIAAVTDDGSVATIEGVDATSPCGDHRVLYTADTIGGSSGSPVLARSDHTVVALHSCGVVTEPCRNSGIDIRGVVADLRAKGVVPQDALDDPTASVPDGPWLPGATPSPTPPPTPGPTQSVCRIFIYQASCETTLPGRCKWLDGKCVANDGGAATATPAPTLEPTPTPTSTPSPTTPEPTTPAPTTKSTVAPKTPTPTTPRPTTLKPKPTTPKPRPTTLKPTASLCALLRSKSLCQQWPSTCFWKSGACVAVY